MRVKKWQAYVAALIIGITTLSLGAATTNIELKNNNPSNPSTTHFVTPPPPDVTAKSYVLMDYNSGRIIAEKNADKQYPPASLTKLMTLYIVSSAIQTGQTSLDSEVRISEKAWKTGGSRMFVKVNSKVPVKELLQGVIVASGNDACVAMAEHIAGSESSFADMMNQTAKALNMNDSHFTDSTGLPHKNHVSTAKDFAILARALIQDFPEYYHWYKQKWFTYNDIKQPNRNRLLWRDESVDGLKTGHTNAAGYCLVSSAKRNDMRLIAVTMGSTSENARANDAQALLNYGFRFFESHKLFSANTPVSTPRVWLAKNKKVAVGFTKDFYVTIPAGQYPNLKAKVIFEKDLKAPIIKGKSYGKVVVTLNNEEIGSEPLIALTDNPKGSIFTRIRDRIILLFHGWFA